MILSVLSLIGGLVYVAKEFLLEYLPLLEDVPLRQSINLYLRQASPLERGIWFGLVVSGSVCIITSTIILVYTLRPFLLWRKLSTGFDEEDKKRNKAKAGL